MSTVADRAFASAVLRDYGGAETRVPLGPPRGAPGAPGGGVG